FHKVVQLLPVYLKGHIKLVHAHSLPCCASSIVHHASHVSVPEAVANARLRQYVTWPCGVLLYLCTKLSHIDPEQLGIGCVLRPPHLVKQSTVRNQFARISHQYLQQSELGGAKVDGRVVHGDNVALPVKG